MVRIELDEATAARLQELAAMRGKVDIAAYLRTCVAGGGSESAGDGFASEEEFVAALQPLLVKGPGGRLTYSREDIYFDHD